MPPHYFSAQSYLRYQGTKFVQRFDPNCYIAITRKLDTHDISRGRGGDVTAALGQIEQPTLVIGISSDGLFTFTEQERLAELIPNAHLEEINSPEGHDAFLLEFVQINRLMMDFIRHQLPEIVDADGNGWREAPVGAMTKSSVFGEAESADLDVTNW
jgi:homoserine O-acetyltransferase